MDTQNIVKITDDLCYVDGDSVEKLFFTVKDFENEKQLSSYIKSIEKMIRGSREYRSLISYIKTELKLTNCTVWNNIDSAVVKIEQHHSPFTLYDLVEIIIEKRLRNDQPITTFGVSEEVMYIHYMGLVGLIQVSATAHELIHSGKIEMTKDQTIGNVVDFVKIYKPYMNEIHLNKFAKYEASSGKHSIKDKLFDQDKFEEDVVNKRIITQAMPTLETINQLKEIV